LDKANGQRATFFGLLAPVKLVLDILLHSGRNLRKSGNLWICMLKDITMGNMYVSEFTSHEAPLPIINKLWKKTGLACG
jgi:hypothetical protein